MSKEYVHTQALTIGYRSDSPLACNLTLTLREGDITTLIGGNGIGKSTLMRTLSGDLRPLNGYISIMGTPLSTISHRRLATLLAVVDTGNGMAGGLTVSQFVELGRQPYTGMLGFLSDNDRKICRESIQDCGISYKSGAYIATLSDGERQKAMIARALAQDTPIIYLDEPFSFLDPAARLEIMLMLKTIATKRKKAILLTCHDVALSLRMASRLWLFTRNKTVLDMSAKEAIASGTLDNLYSSDAVRFSAKLGDYIIDDKIIAN